MFFWHHFSEKYDPILDSTFLSKFVVLGYIFTTMYHVRQTEIVCQSYDPGKLKHQFTETGPIVLALHLLGLGFWTFRVPHCFLNNK